MAISLLIVSQEFPYPPLHGGVADVYRRLLALKRNGMRVGLVCWTDDDVQSPQFVKRQQYLAGQLDFLWVVGKQRELGRDVWRLFQVASGLPSHVAARCLNRAQYSAVLSAVRVFAPDCVVMDSLYGGECAKWLARDLDLPMIYRAHNIEHQYFKALAKAAVGLKRRMALYFACLNLERYERSTHQHALGSWDISASDLAYWRAQGFGNGGWLPPLPSSQEAGQVVSEANSREITAPTHDITFLGNLNAPNNVRGIEWLVTQVMPLVWRKAPDLVLTVAGSAPSATVMSCMGKDRRLRLMANVENAHELLEDSRVLVNPVLAGSGVNVKTIDMLMTDRPIITTPQGVAGLGPEIASLCTVASDADEFSESILRSLQLPAGNTGDRTAAREFFNSGALRDFLSDLQTLLKRKVVS